MSNARIRIAVGLLLILNLALPVLLSPFGLTPGVDVTSPRVGHLTIGASLAQPALLAVWAALAPQPLLRRGMHALAMLFLSNLALNFAKVLNRGSRDEPADMLAIIVLLRLERLSLGPSNAGDGALATLGELPELGELSLFATRVTDKGLRDLRKFPNLADLDLRATDIGDDGLLALADLEHLRVVDLCLTRVTQRGIARLQRARPGLRISSTTDDSTLAIVTSSFQPRRTVVSRPAGWRPIAVRLHAVGPAVTDVGVAALRGMTNIEELDLTDTSVSDAAVGDLATLSRLKKLVLGGTQVSESGIARLRQALPGCTIEP